MQSRSRTASPASVLVTNITNAVVMAHGGLRVPSASEACVFTFPALLSSRPDLSLLDVTCSHLAGFTFSLDALPQSLLPRFQQLWLSLCP